MQSTTLVAIDIAARFILGGKEGLDLLLQSREDRRWPVYFDLL